MNKFLSLFVLLALLPACRLIGPYKRPPIDIPRSWRYPADETYSANLAWWKGWHDPVLNRYICIALRNNKDIRKAVYTVRAACASYCIARSYLLPEIDANMTLMREKTSSVFLPIPGQQPIINDINPYASLSWEIDLWQRVRCLSDAALFEFSASVAQRRSIVLMTVGAVATAYIRLRQFDGQLEIANKTWQSRLESLKLAVMRYEGGLTSQMEVFQAESEAQAAQEEKVSLELNIQLEENQLCILMGINPQSLARGLTIDQLQTYLKVPAGIPSNLLCRRPDIVQAEDQLVAAHEKVGAAKALFYPQVNLTAEYGAQSPEWSNLFSGAARTWNYGITIFEPIFNAGRTGCQVDYAKDIRWQAYMNYANVIQSAFKEVDDSLIIEQKKRELIAVVAQRVKALEAYYKLAVIRYENGESDYLTVLDAERTLFRAQLDLTGVEGDHAVSYVDLFKSLGGGWVNNADRTSMEHQWKRDCCCQPWCD